MLRYLEDCALSIDNNACERAIKPFVIGRKNFLFANTPRGARSRAHLYSLIETARANGLNPQAYLQRVFEVLPGIDPENPQRLDDVLAWNVDPVGTLGIRL